MFEFLSYDFVLTTHITAFIITIALVIMADISGLFWVLGKKEKLGRYSLMWLHHLIWIGMVVSIITGSFMFWEARDYLLTVSAFYIKMSALILLIVNSFVIHKHLLIATQEVYENISSKTKLTLQLSAVVSVLGWVTVFVAAQFLGL